MKKIRRTVLNPRVIIPAVIAFGLLGAVLALGNPSKIWALMVRVGWQTIVVVVALTVPYLAARGLVWRRLLIQQGAQVPLGVFLLAFSAGEFAKDLPGGAYVEDYLLSRANVPVAKSVTATTALSALETIIALPLVLVWGIPGWGWVRLSLACVLATYVVIIATLWYVTNPSGSGPRLSGPHLVQETLHGVREFLVEASHLVSWRTLRDNLLPTIVYCGIDLVDIYVLARAVGAPGITFHEAAVVFGFTTLTMVLLPIPTSLGVTEASGSGALVAFGAAPAQAVAALLLLRVLLTGTTMLITVAMMLGLWRRVVRRLPGAGPEHGDEANVAQDRAVVATPTPSESRAEP